MRGHCITVRIVVLGLSVDLRLSSGLFPRSCMISFQAFRVQFGSPWMYLHRCFLDPAKTLVRTDVMHNAYKSFGMRVYRQYYSVCRCVLSCHGREDIWRTPDSRFLQEARAGCGGRPAFTTRNPQFPRPPGPVPRARLLRQGCQSHLACPRPSSNAEKIPLARNSSTTHRKHRRLAGGRPVERDECLRKAAEVGVDVEGLGQLHGGLGHSG